LFKLFRNKKEESEDTRASEQSVNMQAEEQIQQIVSDQEDQDELIAVITAAVAASLNRTTHNIIVRSVRRIPSVSPAWNRAARLDLTAPKLY
jgi:hypothetical protein